MARRTLFRVGDPVKTPKGYGVVVFVDAGGFARVDVTHQDPLRFKTETFHVRELRYGRPR